MPKWLRYDAGITFYQLLNAIELWYMQLMETSPPGTYRDQQLDNIIGSINSQLDCPVGRCSDRC